MLNNTHNNISLVDYTSRFSNLLSSKNISTNLIEDMNDTKQYKSIIEATTSLPEIRHQDQEMGVIESLANFIHGLFFLFIFLGIILFFAILTGGHGFN